MWDTEVADLLARLDAGFPRVETMFGSDARAAVAARRVPVTNSGDATSEDIVVPWPGHEIGVRLYRPLAVAENPGTPAPVVVFFHGGGFVFCDLDSHDGFCRAMARATGSLVASVDYRRAPEHRAPAAAEDASAAVDWVLEHAYELGGDPARVVVMGDSAGGNLVATACLLRRDSGGPGPAAQVLLYPMIDPACDSESARLFATGHFNTRAATRWYWEQYLPVGGDLPDRPEGVAPLAASSLAGLPPAIVVTAGRDPLRDDGRAYAAALRADGVAALHREYGGLFHGFLTILTLRAADAARDLLWRDLAHLLDLPVRTPQGDIS